MLRVDIAIDLTATRAALAALMGAAGPDRTVAHGFMAKFVQLNTRDYLDDEDGTIHKTATRLGAQPTRFYPKTSRFVKAIGTEEGVTLSMPRAGLSRAFFTYVLRPVHGPKLLTIPIKKESYGKRARDFKGLKWRRFTQEDVSKGLSDTAGLVLGKPAARGSKKKGVKRGMFIALFAGARKTTVPQDREILPSDTDWLTAAEIGLNEYLKAAIP